MCDYMHASAVCMATDASASLLSDIAEKQLLMIRSIHY